MKNSNKSSLSKIISYSTLFIAMTFTTGFVGCSNKSSTANNTSAVLPYGATGVCSNCTAFASTELARPVSNGGATIQANFQVLGDANLYAQLQNNGYVNPMYFYQGPLMLRGGITISPVISQYCQIPPGQYTINTLQQGSKTGQGGMLTFPALEAVNGSTRILLSAQFYLQSSSQFSNDLVGEGAYVIQSVQNYNGASVSCNNLTWSTNY